MEVAAQPWDREQKPELWWSHEPVRLPESAVICPPRGVGLVGPGPGRLVSLTNRKTGSTLGTKQNKLRNGI